MSSGSKWGKSQELPIGKFMMYCSAGKLAQLEAVCQVLVLFVLLLMLQMYIVWHVFWLRCMLACVFTGQKLYLFLELVGHVIIVAEKLNCCETTMGEMPGALSSSMTQVQRMLKDALIAKAVSYRGLSILDQRE